MNQHRRLARCRPWVVGVGIAIGATVLAAAFGVVIYPRIADTAHAVLDSDSYGQLGWGLWQNGSLTYYPDTDPTVARGPLYPAFVAAVLSLSPHWWPTNVQLAQSVLHGLTCLLVWVMARRLWTASVAVAAATLCAVHPVLLWYTSRLWSETLTAFLFTGLAAATMAALVRPSVLRSCLVGLIIGAGALCKTTFLPYALVVPLLMRRMRGRAVSAAAMAALVATAVAVVLPWSVRNWQLTGRVVPVQVLVGCSFAIGDGFLEHYREAPLRLPELYDVVMRELPGQGCEGTGRPGTRAEREAAQDAALLQRSLARYVADPGVLLRKMGLNAWLFWSLSETRLKSTVWMVLQWPLVALFLWAAVRAWRRDADMGVGRVHVLMVALYFAQHLPLQAVARYSVGLVPLMVMYACGALGEVAARRRDARRRDGTNFNPSRCREATSSTPKAYCIIAPGCRASGYPGLCSAAEASCQYPSAQGRHKDANPGLCRVTPSA